MESSPNGQPRAAPARAGFHWLARGLGLLRAQPARLLLIAVVMQAILGLSQIPLLGIVIILAMPALTAGLLEAFRQVDAGRTPALATLFSALSAGPRTGSLFAFGALMFGVGVLTVTLSLGSGGGLDPELMARIEQGDMDALGLLDPEFLRRMAVALAAAVSITGMLSYLTIPLIWFNGLRVGQALVTGLRAMLVNWKPFLALGLGLAALLIPVMMVVSLVLGVVGATPGGSVFLVALLMLFVLAFQLAIFATQYCAHESLFGAPGGPPKSGPAAETDSEAGDQLVA